MIDSDTRHIFENEFGDWICFDEPMSAHTYFKVGGPADIFATPATRPDLKALIAKTVDMGLPFFIIGDGSNLLVKDSGIRGVVISLTKGFNQIDIDSKQDNHCQVRAMAGAKLSRLCRFAIRNGFCGMNFAMGIPGTVGGGIVMNAGTAKGNISQVLKTIEILLPDGTFQTKTKAEFEYGYRSFALRNQSHDSIDHFIVLSGLFELMPGDKNQLNQEAKQLLKQRKMNQPLSMPSAGCFFKNPNQGPTAGELIDRAGLKGKNCGDAQVSTVHANFIINRNQASAKDILNLMQQIQTRVLQQFKIQLEPEVKIIGD